MDIIFNNKSSINTLILGLAEGFNLQGNVTLDADLKTLVTQIVELREFKGKSGQRVTMATPHHVSVKCIILVGLGKREEFNSFEAAKFGARLISILKCSKFTKASIMMDSRLLEENESEICANIAYGLNLREYSFDKYKSSEKLKDKTILSKIEVVTNASKEAQSLFEKELKPVAQSVNFSRDLISEPPNVIYPESFSENSKEELEKFGVKVEILGEADMYDLEMHALLGVGQGSAKESKLLVMQYNGGKEGDAPLSFVGKGVTFDTGGISLKPSARMEEMKYDMSGAAIVTGLMRSLAARKAKVNVVAIAALSENMPDGNAQRPADVVKSMSGQTIEILNTDAEGRLVLADALWYCQNRFKPKVMIDLATLTGAIVVSLGGHHAGLFSNNEELSKDLLKAGKDTDEKLWELPLTSDYDKMIDSSIADVRNTGNGKGAGSITAAQFLKRFVNNVTWAHIDIAGVSWDDKSSGFSPAGATGFGVRLLNEFVKKHEK